MPPLGSGEVVDVQPITKAAAARKRTIKSKRKQSQIDKRECDRLFSLIVRKRDGRCVWCGTTTKPLDCSHLYSRRYISIRCDELNAVAKCKSCHARWAAKPLEGIEWLQSYYTPEQIATLRERAQVTGVKVDWHELRKSLKARAIELGAI